MTDIDTAHALPEQPTSRSLADLLANGDGFPLDLVLDMAQQTAEYLQTVHQGGAVFGMLDTEALFFDPEGGVRLQAGAAQQLIFQAPEVRAGEQPSPRADFYALGALLFEALTGQQLALDPEVLYPGAIKPGLPPEVDELIAKCLQADPAKRVQSAAEFLHGIEEVRQGLQAGGQDTILGMEDVLVGHTLGAYQLVERLGQGGMATVYKAYEPALDRYVAIKVLPQFFARDPTFMQRFRREAKAVAQLTHPNIVPIYSYGESDGITYIAMQFVEGGTLKQTRGQIYAPEEAVRLALPIVRALAFAHKRGIVHRDIKPANVLISEGDWPLLSDFGLAKMAENSGKLTGTGVGMGTPMYMSPEQGQGVDVDHRTDIYSMGIMLYEMLTGDVPFRADTPMAIVIKHMTAPLPMPRSVNPDIPESLERIILKATAKKAGDRFQTADELVAALERLQNTLLAAPEDTEALAEIAPARKKLKIAAVQSEKSLRAPLIKKTGLILGSIVGVLLLGVLLMWVFGICPPAGPWPIPPWCPGTSYKLPTFSASQPTATMPAQAIGEANTTPPTATPTAAELCGPGETLLLYEDFEDGKAQDWVFTDSLGVPTVASDIMTDEVENHVMQMAGHKWAIYPDVNEMNIIYSLRFRKGDMGSHFQINLRIAKEGEERYFLNDGVLKKGDGGEGLIVKQFEADLLNNTRWHDLTISAIGDRIQVFIDDALYIDYQDENALPGGFIGIENISPAMVWYDDIVVCKADETPKSDIFLESDQTLNSGFVRAIALGDVDLDGDLDLAAGNSGQPVQVWLNSGDGQLIAGSQFGGDFMLGDLALADFDSDGDLDAFLATFQGTSPDSGPSEIWLNDGFGAYSHSQTLTENTAFGVAVADFDGDSDLDVWEAAGGQNAVWLNDGAGTFTQSAVLEGRDSVGVALGDLDGDGDVDAFVANYVGGADGVFLNDGAGNFFASGQQYGGPNSNDVTLGDLDGDGDLDAFIAKLNDEPNQVWLNNGSGLFTDSGQALGNATSNTVVLGDLDGDGDLDAFVANGDMDQDIPQANEILLNDGQGNFSRTIAAGDIAISSDGAFYDFNGDGWLDLVESTSEAIYIYLNQGSSVSNDSEKQRIEIRPACGTEYAISANVPSEIQYGGWLAVGADYAQNNWDHLAVTLTLDGEIIAGSKQPIQPIDAQFPGIECRSAELVDPYGFYYVANIESLAPGEHTFSMEFIADAQITDGADQDGDGVLDFVGPGSIFLLEGTIIANP